MKKLSRIKGLIALALCACMFLSMGAVVASADDTNSNIAETHSFVDLPYNVGYSDFGYYNAGYVDYTLKIGLFDANLENFNLKPFDTWANDKKAVTLSTINGLEARDWQWSFAQASSVVLEIKSKVEGTIQFDFSGVSFVGWLENWNSVFGLFRYNAASGTVDTLARNWQSDASKPLDVETYNHTVAVQAGDIVYFEIGSQAGGRNIQNIQYGKIIVTPNTVNAVVAGAYAKKLDSKVAGLVQANYAETDWDAINAIVAEFKAGSYDSVDALVGAYNSAVANIDAIKPDLVKDIRTTLINSMNSLVAGLQSANYTSEAWATITAAKDAFLNAAPSLTTESELNALYEEKVAEIKAVKPYKQTFTFLDYPSKMNANGYTWIEGEVFDTKLYAGTVNDMKEFDTRGKTEHIMFNAELNAGFDLSAPAYYVENWKWFIGYNAGVIIAYRAEVDMKLTINNNYMEEYGTASNGWTSETAFTYYIVRNGELKKIKEVNAPTRDEDFCGECYLKAGDMLYIEFNSTVIDVGTTRNAEAPCGMTAEADSTAFDAELYAEQNNDLAPEVISAINEKKEALESYYATLSESDYSATNWLTLAQYIESFVERSENEVETVSDVEALYSEIKANMEGVKTVAQTAKELQDTLKAYADDLQAEYDKLVEANKYSSENKAALDKALADGKAKILAAKSATLGNQEKIKAIAALKAVEVGSAGLDCASSLATTMVMPLMAIAICLFAKKKND